MIDIDSKIAQKIIINSYHNFVYDNPFHHNSMIFKKSNERINCYQQYLENKKDILSVISSSDQIINCILGGTVNIDAFDISTFPKYFLYLKLAAIMTLSKEDYIKFFYKSITTSDDYNIYYDLIRKELDKENKTFWDSLFGFFDWYDIYNSTLFSSELVTSRGIAEQNKYLQDENYEIVKNKIKKVNINTYTGNILTLVDELKKAYDLIYLSNIIYYENIEEYKIMLEKFNLKDNGIILTYLYKIVPELFTYFREPNYEFEQFDDTKQAIMIYKKR